MGGIMLRCQKIGLAWKTLANALKSTALLKCTHGLDATDPQTRVSIVGSLSVAAFGKKIDKAIKLKLFSTAMIDGHETKSCQLVRLLMTMGLQSMCLKKNKIMIILNLWHLSLHLLLLISDWKLVCEPEQEAWWGKEYSLTWEMEHTVLYTATATEPNLGCKPLEKLH